MQEKMNMGKEEALQHLADPYSMFSVELGRAICAALHVVFPEELVVSWDSPEEAKRYDILVSEPGRGIKSMLLSCSIADCLEVPTPEPCRPEVWAYYNAREVARKIAMESIMHCDLI